MNKRLATLVIALGMMGGLMAVSAAPQNAEEKPSESKMSSEHMKMHQQAMDKMSKMSTDDKAAMFDHMTDKDKMSAMKMAGHDMSKMSHQESMDMMSKMSAEEKAGVVDKMPDDKKMEMMNSMDKMKHDKMEKK